MSTYGALLDRHVAAHTWMLFPPHHFGRAMQASAFAHLDRWLRVPGT